MVTAVPVILGSVLRIPIGYWTNRFEQENYSLLVLFYYYFLSFYISVANSMMDLIIGGLFVGIGGAVFSVGVTSLPKYFPKESHGFVNGIYGVGNAGTAITSFLAPVIATSVGWRTTVQCYLVLLADLHL